MRSLVLAVLAATLFAFPDPAAGMQDHPSSHGAMGMRDGHSAHGEAFDRGPRQKPWVIAGIGHTHFPITTSNGDVQKWFDQGQTLIHSFSYYEAERAFRWCLKLDPNAAMAYWGLARSYYWRERNIEREATFLREASKRKSSLTDRERMYVEAWEVLYTPDAMSAQKEGGAAATDVRHRLLDRIRAITTRFPEDVEAKALLAWEGRGVLSRDEMEALLQQVLAKEPDHPGAHHYRIHIWDGRDADRSRDSAAAYARIVTNIGHAVHMPGHTYSVLGQWHEAAAAMAEADRVEREYLRQARALPFESWNYAHNRNYLSYIQEQLGMAEAALNGARELLAAPLDPVYNNPDEYGTHWQGTLSLVRGLITFERWSDLLAPSTTMHWRPVLRDRMWRAYAETLAHLGLGQVDDAARTAASHAALETEIVQPQHEALEDVYRIQSYELRGVLAIARNEMSAGFDALGEGAQRQAEWWHTGSNNDPPMFPNLLYVELGEAYLRRGMPGPAVDAFERALHVVANDGFALAGLADAYGELGETAKAQQTLARLLDVWSNADRDLKWLGATAAKAREATRRSAAVRRTATEVPDGEWQANPAPRLDAVDSAGRAVSLDAYRGKNIVVVFWLGQACDACLRQLAELGRRAAEFRQLDTEIVAIGADPRQANAALLKREQWPIRIATDVSDANAKRFKAYCDYEELALSATVLIDRKGRVHWARSGGAPFDDIDFVLEEIRRMKALSEGERTRATAAPGAASRR